MSTHFAHRLPWASLGEVIRATRPPAKGNGKILKPTRKQLHVVYHFAKCLVNVIQEFVANNRSSEEVRTRYDAATWTYMYDTSRGTTVGYYNSLIEGYMELNLILSNPTVFTSMVTPRNIACRMG